MTFALRAVVQPFPNKKFVNAVVTPSLLVVGSDEFQYFCRALTPQFALNFFFNYSVFRKGHFVGNTEMYFI